MRTKRRNQLKKGDNPKKYKRHEGSASIAKWKKREDIEFDEEDAFHENRDKIMLEGEEADLSDDDLKNEVFPLNNLRAGSESSEEELEELPDETDEGEIEKSKAPKAKKATKATTKKSSKDLVASSSESSSDSEERHESWGRKKSAYYSTNAAAIESDDEEGQRLEEAEVVKLQTQARATLDEDDFGVNDAPPVLLSTDEVEATAMPAPPVSQNPEALIRHLEKTSPETLALAREWEDVAHDLAQSQQAIDQQDKATSTGSAVGMLQLYHQTLLTYATTLAFYLHMRATPKYATNPKLLHAHPVLSRLLSLKQAMASLERLDFGPNSDGDDDEDEDDDDDDEGGPEDYRVEGMRLPWGDRNVADIDLQEFRELIREAQGWNNPQSMETKKTEAIPNGKSKSKESKSGNKERKSKKPVFDLEEPEFIPASALNGTSSSSTKSKSKSKPSPHSTSAFGEYTSLDATDAQDKSARKKSLRFHTSKIESASSRRAKARGAAMGGDDDIPYKERERAKEARMAAESARKMAKGLLGQGGEDLEDVQEGRGVKRAREEEGEEEVGVDGYYELVKRQKRDQRDEKKALYDAQKAAEKAAREGDGDESENGPRSLTRAILKNKGLTPSRSKTVRNPRVKKRIKYDEAKKKVRSQKAVFKGGLASSGGRYDGESSGISTRIVKSVRLG